MRRVRCPSVVKKFVFRTPDLVPRSAVEASGPALIPMAAKPFGQGTMERIAHCDLEALQWPIKGGAEGGVACIQAQGLFLMAV